MRSYIYICLKGYCFLFISYLLFSFIFAIFLSFIPINTWIYQLITTFLSCFLLIIISLFFFKQSIKFPLLLHLLFIIIYFIISIIWSYPIIPITSLTIRSIAFFVPILFLLLLKKQNKYPL